MGTAIAVLYWLYWTGGRPLRADLSPAIRRPTHPAALATSSTRLRTCFRMLLALVAAMDFLDNALSLITLLSLFLLGPALGRAMIACFSGWQDWWLPIQHLAIGICTMIAVTGMVFAYGALWKLSPKSVAWYTWIQQVPVTGNMNVTGPVDLRPPLKK